MKAKTILLAAITSLILSGCNSTTQTTSGTDYLSKYPDSHANNQLGSGQVNREVMEVASVEPLLQFPARIGLARIVNGDLSNLPREEGRAWQEAANRIGKDFGEFVPISPLIAEMVYGERAPNTPRNTREIIRKIRLGAARQHLDAVLIYEVYSQTRRETLSTAVANWTIIGAYVVPSEKTETVGFSNALLVDVRNGYPYGTATASATKKNVFSAAVAGDKKRGMEERNRIASSLKLIPEVEDMMKRLKRELGNGKTPSTTPSQVASHENS